MLGVDLSGSWIAYRRFFYFGSVCIINNRAGPGTIGKVFLTVLVPPAGFYTTCTIVTFCVITFTVYIAYIYSSFINALFIVMSFASLRVLVTLYLGENCRCCCAQMLLSHKGCL